MSSASGVLMDKSRDSRSILCMQFLDNFCEAYKYCWGSASLPRLYRAVQRHSSRGEANCRPTILGAVISIF